MRALLYIHLVGVAFWLGSQLFLLAIVIPALRGLAADERAALLRKVGMAYGKVAAPVLAVVLASGIAMAARLHLDPADSSTLRWKLCAVAVVLVATVVHSVASARGQRRAARIGSVTALGATLAAVWFATGL